MGIVVDAKDGQETYIVGNLHRSRNAGKSDIYGEKLNR